MSAVFTVNGLPKNGNNSRLGYSILIRYHRESGNLEISRPYLKPTPLFPGWYAEDYCSALLEAHKRISPSPQHKRKRKPTEREKIILQAIARGLEGKPYCEYLDEHGVTPRDEWVARGCPGKYLEMYFDTGYWMRFVSDERHRVNQRHGAKKKKPRT